RRLRLRHEEERPLVVMRAAVVDPDRFLRARAHDAHDAAGKRGARNAEWRGAWGAGEARRGRTRTLRGLRLTAARPGRACARRAWSASARARRAGSRREILTGRECLKILAGDWVLEPLAKKPLIDEQVDVLRQGARTHLALEQSNGARVLLAAE